MAAAARCPAVRARGADACDRADPGMEVTKYAWQHTQLPPPIHKRVPSPYNIKAPETSSATTQISPGVLSYLKAELGGAPTPYSFYNWFLQLEEIKAATATTSTLFIVKCVACSETFQLERRHVHFSTDSHRRKAGSYIKRQPPRAPSFEPLEHLHSSGAPTPGS